MSVALVCPNLKCKALLKVPARARGRKVRCPQCQVVLSVPGGGKDVPDAAPAPAAKGK